nr:MULTISPECIES: GAF domain-containing protein [Myxococcaceae]
MLGPLRAARTRTEVLGAVEEVVCQLVGCEEFALLELDAASGALVVAHQVGLKVGSGSPWPTARGLIHQAARAGVPYIAGRSFGGEASSDEWNLSGCVPVRDGTRICGVLALFRLLPHKRQLTQADADLLSLLAQEAGRALKVLEPAGAPQPLAAAAPVRPPLAALPRAAAGTFVGTAHTLVPAAEPTPSLVYLHPGELYSAAAASGAVEVSTILGSCVAVCLWDSRLRVGGVNHYLLPTSPGGPDAAPHRYGDGAIPALVDALQALGSRRSQLQAKVFGGASVGAGPGAAEAANGVGARNVQQALRMLAVAGIPVVEEGVGGSRSRKLRFRLSDGVASVKVLGGAA